MTPHGSLGRLAVALAGSLAAVGAAGALAGAGVRATGGEANPLARPPATVATPPVARLAPVARVGPPALAVPGVPGAPVAGPRGGTAGIAGARWRWPLEPRPTVVHPFRAPRSTWGAGHRGLDLATRVGAAVVAVEDGRVTHARVVAGRGTVSVRHRDGLLSTYEPVRPGVAVGDEVSAGDAVGVVEPGVATHCRPLACLHLGARRAGAYLDPWPLLAGGEIALLPLR